MNEVLTELEQWTARGDRVALATVVAVRRSAPRPPGAKMAVNEHGEIAGSVSGGCVEGAVVEVAMKVIDSGDPQLLEFGIADDEAWSVGLPCGGEIEVWVEVFEPGSLDRIARAGGRGVEITQLEGPGAGAKLLVEPDAVLSGSLGGPEIDDEAARVADELLWGEQSMRRGALFFDVVAPPPRLILFGAVDVAAALCRLARVSGWRPYVVDPRSAFATRARFPDAEEIVVAWPQEAFERLGGIDAATSIAVLTHDPKLDDAALLIALRSPARFVGAMGSRRAQETRRERLLAAGLTEAELDRLAAPLGLDLGALTREETALSILGEIVAVRYGHDGGMLRRAAGRIHEVGA